MSEFTQPGQHPDADQLSAFAENALPAHERAQTLAHLAGCSDCRTIVSLALPPMEDVPQLQPAAARRPWFYGWNVAWLAGAGLAALIFLTVHIRDSGRDGKTASTPTQTAEVDTAAPPQAAPMEPAATNAAPMPARKTAPAMPTPRATDSVEALKTPAAGATMNNRQIANLPIEGRRFIAQPQQQQLTQQQQAGALHGSAFGAATGAALAGRVAQADQSPTALRDASSQGDKYASGAPAAPPPPMAAAPVMNAEVQRVPAPPASATRAAPQNSNAITVDAESAQVETTNASVSMTLDTLGNIDARRLPSRLAIASTITRANETLALDTAGALFRSSDGGRHWKTVASQWPGRAVKVELASLPVEQPARAYVDGNASASDLASFDARAITGSSVAGIVTDPAGAVIPNVSINVTDTRTRIVRASASDHSGHYAVGGLAPDTYQIDASAPGFQSWRGSVTLAAAQQSVVNISLRVGAANETVEVSSQATIMLDKATKKTRKDVKTASLSGPSAAFEITTDGGEIWTSADGKNWKRK